jgi:hypothetical protein
MGHTQNHLYTTRVKMEYVEALILIYIYIYIYIYSRCRKKDTLLLVPVPVILYVGTEYLTLLKLFRFQKKYV